MKTNKISSPKPVSPPSPPPEAKQNRIAALAREIWNERGRPEGSDLDHWLEAERRLRGEVRGRAAADELPASDEALDPTRTLGGEVERELDHVAGSPPPRSPTSL